MPYILYFEHGEFLSYDLEVNNIKIHCYYIYHFCWSSAGHLQSLRHYQLVVLLNVFLPLVLAFVLCYVSLMRALAGRVNATTHRHARVS